MPDEEEEVEEEEVEEVEEEEVEEAPIATSSIAAASTQSEEPPQWAQQLQTQLDHVAADLAEVKRKVRSPRSKPVKEQPIAEELTGNRQERHRKRNQRRLLGRLVKGGK